MKLTTPRFTTAVFLIFTLALIARLGLTHQFVGLDAPPDAHANSDQLDYEILAYHLVTGEGYAITPGKPTAARTPGTSFTLAPVYSVFGRSFTAGRVWFCVLSALTCVLAVWLGTIGFNRAVGLLAGLGLALYPGHAYNAMHFVSETPFGFWMMLALVATAIAFHNRQNAAVKRYTCDALAGLCWAMAIYARPQLLLAVPFAGGLAMIALLMRNREPFKHAAVQVAVLAMVLSPWVMRNAVVMGKPTISTITGYGLWGSHNELTFTDPSQRGTWVKASVLIDEAHPLSGDEVARNDQATRYGVDAIRANMDQMPILIAAKLWRLVTPIKDTDNRLVQVAFAASWIAVAPFFVWGTLIGWRRSAGMTWLLMLPVLATVASTVVFYGSVRFRDAVAPVFIVLAAAGGQWVYQRLAGRDTGKSSSANIAANIGPDRPQDAAIGRAA